MTDWLHAPIALTHEPSRTAAWQRQAQLTKPPGALGDLEAIAVKLAAMQGSARPCADNVWISVFAGDHGVAEENVSAFPPSVTVEMLRNFANGGAAINVLARAIGATLEVVDVGTARDIGELPNVRRARIASGTANFTRRAAMTDEQCRAALDVGRKSAERAQASKAHIFIGGEMGIANTTAATALACALLDGSASRLVGPGTGVDAHGIARKVIAIERALALHRDAANQPLDALSRLGGFEIAALAGAYLACAKIGLPILIDGFISSAAALAAERICPGTAAWMFFGHASAEPGHRHLLDALNAQPLLQLGMRLGEGSGAATAIPTMRLACALHNEMATFAEAAVSNKT